MRRKNSKNNKYSNKHQIVQIIHSLKKDYHNNQNSYQTYTEYV